jgi:hypothetical protein
VNSKSLSSGVWRDGRPVTITRGEKGGVHATPTSVLAPNHMVDPGLDGYFNGVAELLRSPSPVREAGKEAVVGRDRRGWRGFLEMETNEERGVKDEGHGY